MKTKTIYIVLAVLAVIIIAGVIAKKKEDNSKTDKNTNGKIFSGSALEIKHKNNENFRDTNIFIMDGDSVNSDNKVFQRAKFII